jgi:hypothetical protein
MDLMLVEHGQPIPQGANTLSTPATHGDLEDLHRHVRCTASRLVSLF